METSKLELLKHRSSVRKSLTSLFKKPFFFSCKVNRNLPFRASGYSQQLIWNIVIRKSALISYSIGNNAARSVGVTWSFPRFTNSYCLETCLFLVSHVFLEIGAKFQIELYRPHAKASASVQPTGANFKMRLSEPALYSTHVDRVTRTVLSDSVSPTTDISVS